MASNKKPASQGGTCRPFNPAFVTRNPLHYADGPGADEVIGANRLLSNEEGNTDESVSGS
jgi:hypothetical protein